jgi:hypothetical protein
LSQPQTSLAFDNPAWTVLSFRHGTAAENCAESATTTNPHTRTKGASTTSDRPNTTPAISVVAVASADPAKSVRGRITSAIVNVAESSAPTTKPSWTAFVSQAVSVAFMSHAVASSGATALFPGAYSKR